MTDKQSELDETRALLESSIVQLSETTRASHPSTIARLPGPPTARTLSLYKTRSFPVVFMDAFAAWPAHSKWSAGYFESVMGNDQVTVAVTPHGNADSITDGLFVMPHEEQTSMSDMISWLRHPVGNVWYLQLQNGSLHIEFQKLAGDVDAYGPIWARDAFALPTTSLLSETNSIPSESGTETTDTNGDGTLHQEDLVKECSRGDCLGNIWIGNHRSKTSLHHDPYENIYVQIRGAKKFTLYPPCEYHWLHERRYTPAKYVPDESGNLVIEKVASQSDNGEFEDQTLQVPWLSGPSEDDEKRGRTAQGHQVTLQAGETLYLPALWFHTVEQIDDEEGLCVALNYWYDLDYDSDLWRNWKFIRKMSMLAHGRLDECRRELQDEEDF